jgi:hypothetical protein
MIANISSSLLQPGGFLMCNVTIGATAYYTNTKSNDSESTEYSLLPLTSCDVERAYSKAGVTVRECTVHTGANQSYSKPEICSGEGYAACIGVKRSQCYFWIAIFCYSL